MNFSGSKKYWLHPTFVFCFICVLLLLLISSVKDIDQFGSLIYDTRRMLILLLSANLIGFTFAFIFCELAFRSNKRHHISIQNVLIFNGFKQLFIIWFIIFFIETIYSKGLPIFGYLGIPSPSYDTYGIPKIHGFENSIYFYLSIGAFFKYFILNKKKSWLVIFCLIIYPVLLTNRGTILILFILLAGCYITFSKINLKFIIMTFVSISLVVLIFSMIGNARAEFDISEVFDSSSLGVSKSYLIWPLLYFVSPIYNLTYTTLMTQPQYNFFPINTLSNFIPGAAERVETSRQYLVVEFLNASSGFIGSYLDWGLIGIFLICFIIGFIGHVFWKFSSSIKFIPILITFNLLVFLSFFGPFFTNPAYLLLLILLLKFSKVKQSRINPALF